MNGKKILNPKETFDLAVQSHQKNNLQVAENLYKEVLKTNPDHIETICLLGTLLAQTKKYDLAKSLLQKAIKIQPDYAMAHNNLGNLQKGLKEYQKAISSFEKAIEIQPNYVDAHYNLGNMQRDLGEYQKAISSFEKAIKVQPNYLMAYNNLGNIQRELGEYQKAINCYEKAIKVQPSYVRAYNNLGETLLELKEHQKAISIFEKANEINPNCVDTCNNLGLAFKEIGEFQKSINFYEKAIKIEPNNINVVNGLSDLFKIIQLDNLTKNNSSSLKELFLFLFRKNSIIYKDIFNKAKALLFFEETNIELRKIVDSDLSLLKNTIIENLSKEELFLLMLQKSLITDKFLEKLLTKLRSEILFTVIDSKQNVLKENFSFVVSLSEQCFLNEYVYLQSKKEINYVNQLKNKITKSKNVSELEIAILGCYIPLNVSEKITKKLLDYKSNNILFNDLITMQIKEPLKEKKLINSIKSFDKIVDPVSKKVKEQYENYPYPRWRYTYKYLPVDLIFQLNQEIKPNKIEYNKKFTNPNVLIAGCGTGNHIALASRYLNANIIGVDLSLTSLAYAMRKTEELGFKNVEFLHADILQLKNLDKKFDVIESLGTLHHMKDPLAGLKVLLNLLEPHGFLKLGLYSSISRQHIVKGRDFIKKRNFKNTIEDIRNCRELIFNEKKDPLLQKITYSGDFYSTSSVRDLLFHVQEHHFTIPEISKILKNLKLEFLGFTNPNIKTKFSKSFSDDKKNISLDNWNKFEISNPDAFSNMYQFWVRKI